jgi:hypothetical protein
MWLPGASVVGDDLTAKGAKKRGLTTKAPFDWTQGRLLTRRVRIFILLNFVNSYENAGREDRL